MILFIINLQDTNEWEKEKIESEKMKTKKKKSYELSIRMHACIHCKKLAVAGNMRIEEI